MPCPERPMRRSFAAQCLLAWKPNSRGSPEDWRPTFLEARPAPSEKDSFANSEQMGHFAHLVSGARCARIVTSPTRKRGNWRWHRGSILFPRLRIGLVSVRGAYRGLLSFSVNQPDWSCKPWIGKDLGRVAGW